MEKRISRVSEAQWHLLMEFLEHNPNMARARSYNNSARGRAESARLWQEVANVLNAEGTGTTKSAKDWSIYVSNYKSKLKKIIANINDDATRTGGGPPREGSLSQLDHRFLAIMGPSFGQTSSSVMVNPFPDSEQQQPSSCQVHDVAPDQQQPSTSQVHDVAPDQQQPSTSQAYDVAPDVQLEMIIDDHIYSRSRSPTLIQDHPFIEAPAATAPPPRQVLDPQAEPPLLPQRPRRPRQRTRPLAPLDEARRILTQVELQRAASDAANARALDRIGRSLERLAVVAERYLAHIIGPH